MNVSFGPFSKATNHFRVTGHLHVRVTLATESTSVTKPLPFRLCQNRCHSIEMERLPKSETGLSNSPRTADEHCVLVLQTPYRCHWPQQRRCRVPRSRTSFHADTICCHNLDIAPSVQGRWFFSGVFGRRTSASETPPDVSDTFGTLTDRLPWEGRSEKRRKWKKRESGEYMPTDW